MPSFDGVEQDPWQISYRILRPYQRLFGLLRLTDELFTSKFGFSPLGNSGDFGYNEVASQIPESYDASDETIRALERGILEWAEFVDLPLDKINPGRIVFTYLDSSLKLKGEIQEGDPERVDDPISRFLFERENFERSVVGVMDSYKISKDLAEKLVRDTRSEEGSKHIYIYEVKN